MKVFAHGCNINFQESVREMVISDWKRLLDKMLDQQDKTLFGKIDLEAKEVRVYGRLESFDYDEEGNRCTFSFQWMDEPKQEEENQKLEDVYLSHEASFDIVDEQAGPVHYRVLYITFMDEETGDETTYFFADEESVSEPLACVAEFWQQVWELGRDIDFEMFGCSVYDINRKPCGCE